MSAPFVPLRVFSCFSMLEGAIEPKAIARQAKKLGFPAAALVDRNGLYAAMPFTDACLAEGVQLPASRALAEPYRSAGPIPSPKVPRPSSTSTAFASSTSRLATTGGHARRRIPCRTSTPRTSSESRS
jgi:hypothetical protein